MDSQEPIAKKQKETIKKLKKALKGFDKPTLSFFFNEKCNEKANQKIVRG